MSAKRYTEEFKPGAVKQVTDRGHTVVDVAGRLGVTTHSLYAWIKRYGVPKAQRAANQDQASELRRLKAELKRVHGRARHPKNAAAYFAKTSG